jgi:hypothetical protein
MTVMPFASPPACTRAGLGELAEPERSFQESASRRKSGFLIPFWPQPKRNAQPADETLIWKHYLGWNVIPNKSLLTDVTTSLKPFAQKMCFKHQ